MTEFWLTDLPDERLLTKLPQTAALLGASIDTLDRWATRGRGRPRLRAIAGSFRSSQMLSTPFVLAGSTLIVASTSRVLFCPYSTGSGAMSMWRSPPRSSEPQRRLRSRTLEKRTSDLGQTRSYR